MILLLLLSLSSMPNKFKDSKFHIKEYTKQNYDKVIGTHLDFIDISMKQLSNLKKNKYIDNDKCIDVITALENKIMKMQLLLDKISSNHYLITLFISKQERDKDLYTARTTRYREKKKFENANINIVKKKLGRPRLNKPTSYDTHIYDKNKYIENNMLDFLYCNHPDYNIPNDNLF